MLEIMAPYWEANREQQLGLTIDAAGGSTRLEEGSELTLDLGLPDFDSYVEVSYFQRDGTVGHILPDTSEAWPAGGTHPIRDTGYEIAEPFGLEMIVAIATEEPLFAQPRPRFEPTEDYLPDLRARLEELRASDASQRIAANLVLVTTVPATGSF
jgi:eukaryotic-like serine/threonine-protein kinase